MSSKIRNVRLFFGFSSSGSRCFIPFPFETVFSQMPDLPAVVTFLRRTLSILLCNLLHVGFRYLPIIFELGFFAKRLVVSRTPERIRFIVSFRRLFLSAGSSFGVCFRKNCCFFHRL